MPLGRNISCLGLFMLPPLTSWALPEWGSVRTRPRPHRGHHVGRTPGLGRHGPQRPRKAVPADAGLTTCFQGTSSSNPTASSFTRETEAQSVYVLPKPEVTWLASRIRGEPGSQPLPTRQWTAGQGCPRGRAARGGGGASCSFREGRCACVGSGDSAPPPAAMAPGAQLGHGEEAWKAARAVPLREC